jgi:hypothetical protein
MEGLTNIMVTFIMIYLYVAFFTTSIPLPQWIYLEMELLRKQLQLKKIISIGL